MKVDKQELEKINLRMRGWTIKDVESGYYGEDVFVFYLEKKLDYGYQQKTVILGANDLGGWLVR